MTTQLLILGNGFDLQCKLKSSYEDFFKNVLLDTLGEHFGLKQLRAGVSGFWENLLLEYYIKNEDKRYKWCDIESIIKETLLTIFNKQSYIFCTYILDCAKGKQDANYAFSNLKSPIHRYIYKYLMNFFVDNLDFEKHYTEREIIDFIIKNLLNELHNFEKRFCKYLREILDNSNHQEQIDEEYIVNAVNLLNKITGFSDTFFKSIGDIIYQEERFSADGYGTIPKWETKNILKDMCNLQDIYILSFNYTNLFDILNVEAPCTYSNVHGKLCGEKCQENCNLCNIIFGIDDKTIQSNGENIDLRLFSKTYRKMVSANVPINILPPNNIPLQIKFYGHSLSEADYSYFQSIFDYYNLYSNYNVSLLFYYSEGYEQTDAIYNLINEYGKTLSNKEQGKNLLHKLLLEDRLKIIKIS